MQGVVLRVGKPTKRVLLYGGREVLRLLLDTPLGEDTLPVVQHTRALCKALADHAEREILPQAAAELERAVRAGELLSFVPHRYEVELTSAPCGRLLRVELTLRHSQGESTLFAYRLPTYWTADGILQRAKARRMR